MFIKKKKEKEPKSFKRKALESFLIGMIYGLGQALGLTIIFAIIVGYIAKLFNALGGVPFVGIIIADIAEVAQRTIESVK